MVALLPGESVQPEQPPPAVDEPRLAQAQVEVLVRGRAWEVVWVESGDDVGEIGG